MKKTYFILLALSPFCTFSSLCAPVDFTKSTGDLRYDGGHGHTLPYRVFLPPNYDPVKVYPLVLFFHGAGERGDDNLSPCNSHIENLYAATQGVFDPDYQAILLAPQCPKGSRWVEWDWRKGSYTDAEEPPESVPMHSALAIFDEVKKTYRIDPKRIYVTGISMGGFATWYVVKNRPGVFAAAMPLSGGGNKSSGTRFKNLPIWTYHGDPDSVVPTAGTAEMVEVIKKAGGKSIEYANAPGKSHGGWNQFYDNKTYQNAKKQTVFEWLFAQRLGASPSAFKSSLNSQLP